MGRMKSSPVYTISVYEYKYIIYIYLELQRTSSLWLFQLDDSKSLHGKWLEITKHP